MKTYKDLTFEPHKFIKGVQQATITLNGCFISVLKCDFERFGVNGHGLYLTSGCDSHEVMSDRMRGDGVRGWITADQITRHMIYVQKNPLK